MAITFNDVNEFYDWWKSSRAPEDPEFDKAFDSLMREGEEKQPYREGIPFSRKYDI